MKALKQISSYILVGLVLVATVISLLSIWDIISLEDVLKKIGLTLFVIFIATVVLLFIYRVLMWDDRSNYKE